MADEPMVSSISKASTYEEMGEFWDTHSTADVAWVAPLLPIRLFSIAPLPIELSTASVYIVRERRFHVLTYMWVTYMWVTYMWVT
jgi:hypothetical protein